MTKVVNVLRKMFIAEKFINRFSSITHIQELSEILAEITTSLGFVYYWYQIIEKTFRLNELKTRLLLTDYPTEFTSEYIENNRILSCPLYHNAFRSYNHPVFWSELFNRQNLLESEHGTLEWAKEFGVETGVLTPIYGPNPDISLLHFASNKQVYTTEEICSIKPKILSVCLLIDYKARGLLFTKPLVKNNSKLSTREIESLIWAAKGKSIWETAKILNLSEHTVREYMQNCINKFGVSKKTELITKALLNGDITYGDIVEIQ